MRRLQGLRHPSIWISVCALCFAGIGTAVAGTNGAQHKKAKQPGLNSKQKQQVKSIAKGLVQPGPPGPQGPTGSSGVGKDGPSGTDGTDGISPIGTVFTGNQKGCEEGGVQFVGANTTVVCNGKKGSNGTSVTSTEFGTGGEEGHCVGAGGSKFVAGASKTYACNGATGFTETLPSGKTETGGWSGLANPEQNIPLSFSIPLASAPPPANVHIAPNVNCPGTAAEPAAAAGHLCVYIAVNEGSLTGPFKLNATALELALEEEGASKSGAFLHLGGSEVQGWGSWAVTAP